MLTLYGSDISPPTRAVMMLIEILKADVKFQEVNLGAGDNRKPEYAEKNPLCKIPMLEDDKYIIVDSHAALTYLATKFGREDLYSSDLKKRCTVDQRLFFDACILFDKIHTVIYDVIDGKGTLESHRDSIEKIYGLVDGYLKRTKYIAGDDFSIADISCVTSVCSLHSILPISEKYNKLHGWWSHLSNEYWYKKNQPGADIFENYIKDLLKL